MPFDYLTNPDPLGIGLRSRAADYQRQLNPTGLGELGPLRDPMWEGLFQALQEAGVSGVKGGASPEGSNQLRGVPTQPWFLTIPQASGQARAPWSMGGGSTPQTNPALRGLQGQAPEAVPPQGGFMGQSAPQGAGRKFPKVADQRGTSGMNVSKRVG